MTQEKDHAYEQARMQMDSIAKLVERLDHTKECDDKNCSQSSEDFDGQEGITDYHDVDKAITLIHEDALEATADKGDRFDGSRHYIVLLCTGGPAVRIHGILNEQDYPETAELEYQDWGTPWTEYKGDNLNRNALIAYAEQFYFGN